LKKVGSGAFGSVYQGLFFIFQPCALSLKPNDEEGTIDVFFKRRKHKSNAKETVAIKV